MGPESRLRDRATAGDGGMSTQDLPGVEQTGLDAARLLLARMIRSRRPVAWFLWQRP